MDSTLITCPNCSTTNRVRTVHSGLAPICGCCRQRLPTQTTKTPELALSKSHPEHAQKIHWIFAVTVVTFTLGIFSPLMTVSKHVTKFWIELVNEQNTVSLASGLGDLVREGHWGMFLLLFTFSIVFPITKLVLCLLMWAAPIRVSIRQSLSRILYHAGKWSMLDVFVVGVLVVSVKLEDIAEVKLHSGVFWFAASVCFSILLKSSISKIDEKASRTH